MFFVTENVIYDTFQQSLPIYSNINGILKQLSPTCHLIKRVIFT